MIFAGAFNVKIINIYKIFSLTDGIPAFLSDNE
jgi:hypothetical protein